VVDCVILDVYGSFWKGDSGRVVKSCVLIASL
jgi:hypothetical protein